MASKTYSIFLRWENLCFMYEFISFYMPNFGGVKFSWKVVFLIHPLKILMYHDCILARLLIYHLHSLTFLKFKWEIQHDDNGKKIINGCPTCNKLCFVIKQNQSEVGQIQFPVFYLTVCIILTTTFCRKPHWNWSIGSKDMSSKRMPKTIGNKRHFLLCLALSNNQYFRVPTDFAWSHHEVMDFMLTVEMIWAANHMYALFYFFTMFMCNSILFCKTMYV